MRPGPRLVVMVALAFFSGAQSSTNQQQSQSSIRGKLLSNRDESARYDETSPATASTSLLSNINPWLSACDLAQPNTAPDLQVINQSIRPYINRPLKSESFAQNKNLSEKLCRFLNSPSFSFTHQASY
jgi:hypothetical protein